LQSLCQENQNTARQLVEKEQELVTLTNELTQSNQDFAVTLDEQNKIIKSQGEQIATKDAKFNDTAKEYQAAQGLLAEKVALVTRLETALNDANKSLSKMEANLKDKEEEMIAVKSMLDARDVMVKPHEPRGNHHFLGMMNLRGCAWYWLATLPVH
jgi:chromosome segregation ATPase